MLAPQVPFLDRVDPRSRVVAAVVFSLLVAVLNEFLALTIALAVAAAGTLFSALRPGDVIKRLMPVNLFMLCLIALLPWTFVDSAAIAGDSPLFTIGRMCYTLEGLLLAAAITVKGNAIVLALVALLGTLDTVTLGHALNHLRVPDKLTHLLLFTVRYLEVIRQEYLRLRWAMKVRGFRPRMNLHTYRSFGYLVGMLLVVRSLGRSERIVAAMKCRGFRGRFYLFDHFSFSGRDAWFALATLAILAILALVEWT